MLQFQEYQKVFLLKKWGVTALINLKTQSYFLQKGTYLFCLKNNTTYNVNGKKKSIKSGKVLQQVGCDMLHDPFCEHVTLSGPLIPYPAAHTNLAVVTLLLESKLKDNAVVEFNVSHWTEKVKI